MHHDKAGKGFGGDDSLRSDAQRWLGHIRRRPCMYIGDLGPAGLHELAFELVRYGLAEFLTGHAKGVHVRINADGSLSVGHDGRGIPVEPQGQSAMASLEWVMTSSTAVEVSDTEHVFRSSLHGIGVRAVTALSDWAEAEVCWKGRLYRQRYERGLPAGDVCDTGPAETRAGTRITFHPDADILRAPAFEWDRLEVRLRVLACAFKGLALKLSEERTGREVTFHHPSRAEAGDGADQQADGGPLGARQHASVSCLLSRVWGSIGRRWTASLVIRLDPRRLANLDAGLRHRLRSLLEERYGGFCFDEGDDYAGEGPQMLLSLKVLDIERALECVLDVIENVRVLDNDLRDYAVVAIEHEGDYEVVYPVGFSGPFLPE